MNILLLILIAANLLLTTFLALKLSENKISRSNQIVLDTSSVIDGRVLHIAESGFLSNKTLVATNLILDELQFLADGSDSFKRSRARYGLEILDGLGRLKNVELIVKKVPDQKDLEVDQKLLNLAKSSGAQLLTTDYNLAARAKVEGVSTISPVELAEALKPQVLPGETFKLKLIQKGEDKNQAVGYLPDGTMVVAEGLQNKLGQTLELKSTKIIQTAGGRIIFASEHKVAGRGSRSTRAAKDYKSPSQEKSPAQGSAKPAAPAPQVSPPARPTNAAETSSSALLQRTSPAPKPKLKSDSNKAQPLAEEVPSFSSGGLSPLDRPSKSSSGVTPKTQPSSARTQATRPRRSNRSNTRPNAKLSPEDRLFKALGKN